MAGKKHMKNLELVELSGDTIKAIKQALKELHPGKTIVFSRHMETVRPDPKEDDDRVQESCPRCQKHMLSAADQERVIYGDFCVDNLIYCLECLMADQCGCMESA